MQSISMSNPLPLNPIEIAVPKVIYNAFNEKRERAQVQQEKGEQKKLPQLGCCSFPDLHYFGCICAAS
jgi:hypothetical protein